MCLNNDTGSSMKGGRGGNLESAPWKGTGGLVETAGGWLMPQAERGEQRPRA